jgi:hypothetical protein
MCSCREIAVLDFTSVGWRDRRPGLRGWAKFQIGEFEVDGFVVRVDARGIRRLEFPAHFDRKGRPHLVLRHADRRAHRELAGRLLDALERGGWLA